MKPNEPESPYDELARLSEWLRRAHETRNETLRDLEVALAVANRRQDAHKKADDEVERLRYRVAELASRIASLRT